MDYSKAKQLLQQIADAHSGLSVLIESLTAPQVLVNAATDNGASVQPSGWTPQPGRDTGFKWGKKSLLELKGVREELVRCSTMALERFTTIDFMCFDGLRTPAEQRKYVASGASRTMNSKHLTGDAVDHVPIINGVPTWDWDGCYQIAYAMDQAATQMGIAAKIRWGGAWDRTLADFGGSLPAYKRETELYRSRKGGGSVFLDGPHFEWVK